MKYYFLFILTHIIVTSVKSQSDDRIVHWELAVPISYSLNERWKLNTTIANRNGFYENEDETDMQSFLVNFIEVTQYATYRAGNNFSLTLGYRYRDREPFEGVALYEHRLIQQLGYVHFRSPTRLASRLQTEQRWRNEPFTSRVRYRLSLDRPFNGEKLELGEYYFIFSDELVSEFARSERSTLENRFAAGVGRLWSKGLRLQLDIQLRSDDVFDDTDHTIFVLTNFYIRLQQ